MVTFKPPRSPVGDELEALIEEARARRRRRLTLLACGVAAIAGLALAIWALVPGGGVAAHGSGKPSGTPADQSGAPLPRFRPIDSVGASGGVAWAIDGHAIWVTPNGGRTWRYALRQSLKVRGPRVVARVDDVEFVDKRDGWISAELAPIPDKSPITGQRWGIERTVDGGRHWRVSRLPDCGCADPALGFFDARHGYALAGDLSGKGAKLFWTADGGVTWQLVSRLQRYGEITFLDRRNGLLGIPPGSAICGIGDTRCPRWPGVLYRTTDGGRTWSKEHTPPPSLGLRLPVASFGRRLVVEDNTPRHMRVYASADGGAHWAAFSPPTPTNSSDVSFAAGSPQMWAVVTPGKLTVTRDGGRTWSTIVPHGLPRRFAGGQLVFSSPSVGWAVSAEVRHDRVVDRPLYRTTDGGRHWTRTGPRWPRRKAR